MIVDLNELKADPFKSQDFDVCICGAGVAGITLARKLPRHLKVLLLEGGGGDYSLESQDMYQGRNVGHEYFDLEITRLRFFGGTSNHWTGMCRYMDSYDFDPMTYVPHSIGWPISKSDLDPYLEETVEILDLPELTPRFSGGKLWDESFLKLNDFERIDFWWSPPTRFSEKYKSELEDSDNVFCYLNSNVVDIILDEGNGSSVSTISVKNYVGLECAVKARTYVLAAGGIENARMLLNSNSQLHNGVGNGFDNVGRYFSEHLHFKVGEFFLEDSYVGSIKDLPTELSRTFLSPKLDFINRNKCLNFSTRVVPSFPDDMDDTFKQKMRQVLCFSESIERAVSDVKGSPLLCSDGFLKVTTDQAPNPLSRITLNDQLDSFGLNRVDLNWKISDVDVHTLRVAALETAKMFAEHDIGRVRINEWLLSKGGGELLPGFDDLEEVGGHHHMCTTRMASSAKDGVVDKNQKVFGVDNLYIAGCSVFSSGGHANPTFTITQMTLRLSDYLGEIL